MLRRFIPLWIVCGLLLAGGQLPAIADDPMTVDDIIAKHIEAVGGRKNLDAVKTMVVSGKTMMGGGLEMPMRIEFKRPDKVRVEFTVQGMTGIQAFDGERGWFVMPFMGRTDPERMPPDQVEAMQDQADFDGPLVDYKKKGHKVELAGKDEVEGAEVYKLKVTKKNGNVEYHFLDAEYFLIIQMKGKRRFQGTEIDFEMSFSDFKEVGGLVLAHSVSGVGMGGTVVFEKFEFNTEIADQRFTMPEVKPKEADGGKKEAEVKDKPAEGSGGDGG